MNYFCPFLESATAVANCTKYCAHNPVGIRCDKPLSSLLFTLSTHFPLRNQATTRPPLASHRALRALLASTLQLQRHHAPLARLGRALPLQGWTPVPTARLARLLPRLGRPPAAAALLGNLEQVHFLASLALIASLANTSRWKAVLPVPTAPQGNTPTPAHQAAQGPSLEVCRSVYCALSLSLFLFFSAAQRVSTRRQLRAGARVVRLGGELRVISFFSYFFR